MFNLVHSTQQPRHLSLGQVISPGLELCKKIIFHLQTEAHLERKKWKKITSLLPVCIVSVISASCLWLEWMSATNSWSVFQSLCKHGREALEMRSTSSPRVCKVWFSSDTKPRAVLNMGCLLIANLFMYMAMLEISSLNRYRKFKNDVG